MTAITSNGASKCPNGPVPEDYANSIRRHEPRKYFGAIAEDFEDAGLG